MGEACSVCRRQTGFLKGIAITKIDGVAYCQDCYRQRFGHLDTHPISDAMIKGITGVGMEIDKDPEYAFWENDPSHKVRIHRFMYYIPPKGSTVFSSFLGMDLYSRRPVYLYYSENDISSDGGPSSLNIMLLNAQQFSNMLSYYPTLVREKFTDFSPATYEKFKNMTVELDLCVKGFTLMQECYDHIRLVRYCWNASFSYAEIPKEVFWRWRNGKDPLECAALASQLYEKAFWGITNMLAPKLLKKWKIMEQLIEDCFASGTEVLLEEANLIRTEGFSRKLGVRKVPTEKLNRLFAYIQSIFPKQFAARPHR